MAPDFGMIGNFSHWTSPPHTVLPIWESYSGKTSSYIKYYLTLAKHHLTVAKHNESSTLVSSNFPSITITAPPPVMREQIRSVDNGSWGFILGFSKSHCFICVFFYLCICADPIRWVEDLSWDPHNHLLSVIFCIFILFCVFGEFTSQSHFFIFLFKKPKSEIFPQMVTPGVVCHTIAQNEAALIWLFTGCILLQSKPPKLGAVSKTRDLSPTKEALTRIFYANYPFWEKEPKIIAHCKADLWAIKHLS